MVGFYVDPGYFFALLGKSTPSEVTLGRSSDGKTLLLKYIYFFKLIVRMCGNRVLKMVMPGFETYLFIYQ